MSKLCKVCQKPLKYTAKYCSDKCYNIDRQQGKPPKVDTKSLHICQNCDKEFYPTRNTLGYYCSYACSGATKSRRYKIICRCCGIEFEINNIAEIKRGHYRYCSTECRNRKYQINEFMFDDMNSTSIYWMGFIWSQVISTRYNRIKLVSNKSSLERFNKALSSSYPINKGYGDYYISIVSLSLLKKLVDRGLRSDILIEFPNIPKEYINDFIRGYFDSNNGFHYKDGGKDVVALHGKSSKLMREISQIIDGKLVNNNGEWIVLSFDFIKIDGSPKNKEKWSKFN